MSSTNKKEKYYYRKNNHYSYNSTSYSINYCKPPIDNIKEYSFFEKELFKSFSYRKIVAIEKLMGKKFNIFFDGKNVEFRNYDDILIPKGDDYLGFKKLFYDKYSKDYIKLLERLKKVPFNLHGEIIGQDADSTIEYFKDDKKIEIYFFDIYLNSNWMDWEDFSLLMGEYNLPTASVLYNGEWVGKDFYYDLVKKPNIEGIIVRPLYEDISNGNRLITKFTNEKFMPKAKEKSAEFETDIRIFLYSKLKETYVLWEAELIRNEINISDKSNFSKVMSISSKLAMDSINSYIAKEFYEENNKKYALETIKKAMKKELPSMIKHLLGLIGK